MFFFCFFSDSYFFFQKEKLNKWHTNYCLSFLKMQNNEFDLSKLSPQDHSMTHFMILTTPQQPMRDYITKVWAQCTIWDRASDGPHFLFEPEAYGMLFKRNRALHHIFLEPKNSSFSPWLPTGDILEIGQFLKQVTPSCEENNQKQKGRLKLKDSRMCPALSQLLIENYKQNLPVTSICVLFRPPHGGGDYHKNSNTALRPATLYANCDPPTFGKKGE